LHPLPFKERAGVRVSKFKPPPLTLTLSPQGKGDFQPLSFRGTARVRVEIYLQYLEKKALKWRIVMVLGRAQVLA
jgi:hypothetical protein